MQLSDDESLAMNELFNEQGLREALAKKYTKNESVDTLIDFARIMFIEGAERYKSLTILLKNN